MEGLVDAKNSEDFQPKLGNLISKWEDSNVKELDKFISWFRTYKVPVICDTMLGLVRQECGLRCPPEPFTTNACESANFMLKNKVDYKRSDLSAFIQKFREFIREQENEIERAVIGRGKYEFRRQYCYMQVAETEWFAMNTSQRAKHLQKVSSLTLSDIGDSSSDTSHLLCSRNPDMAALSVDLSVLVGTAKLPQTVLEGIWNKTSELLKTDGAIVSAPGLGGGAKYVMSYGGSKPHLVTLKKGGSVCCDADCPNWKGLGICSHVVAVGEYCGVLTQLIANFKKAKKFPNLSKLAEATLPKGSGRKGGEKPRSRKACVQVESRVENPSLGTSARLPYSSQASSWAPSLQQDPSVAMEGFSSLETLVYVQVVETSISRLLNRHTTCVFATKNGESTHHRCLQCRKVGSVTCITTSTQAVCKSGFPTSSHQRFTSLKN